MKNSNYFFLLFFVAFALSCDKLADDCATGDDIYIERTFFFKFNPGRITFEKEDIIYDLSTASSVVFYGNVTKYYCDHEKGGSFDFSNTFYGSIDEPINFTLLQIAGPYNMKFDHSADYVEIVFKIRATFDQNTLFETYDVVVRKYPNQFALDVNGLQYYHSLDFSELPFFTRI